MVAGGLPKLLATGEHDLFSSVAFGSLRYHLPPYYVYTSDLFLTH